MIGVRKISELWHDDLVGMSKPQELRGKKFVHLASSALYIVTGFTLNASTDRWAIVYDRFDEDQRKDFPFSRDMDEFLDGRFVEVK